MVSYNIKGLGSPVKSKKILNQLKALHCSVAMLQETHLSEAEHLKSRRDWVEQIYSASHEGGRKRGVRRNQKECCFLIPKKYGKTRKADISW